MHILKLEGRDSRDGSAVKSTGCFYRGYRCGSEHPHGGPQPSVTPVPGDVMPSFDLYRHHVVHRYT